MNLTLSWYFYAAGADICCVGLISHCCLKRSSQQSQENISSQPRALTCMPLLMLAGPLSEISCRGPSLDSTFQRFLVRQLQTGVEAQPATN